MGVLDSKLTMVDNRQSVTRKAYYALANMGEIRKDLTKPATEKLYSQRLCDFCHGLCKQHQLEGPTSAPNQPTETTEHGISYYPSLCST